MNFYKVLFLHEIYVFFHIRQCVFLNINFTISFQVKGSFSSLEELLSVPGIGRNVLEQNKDVLVCEGALPCILVDDSVATIEPQQEQESGHDQQQHHSVSSRLMVDSVHSSGQSSSSLSKNCHSRRSSRRSSQQDSSSTASCSSNSSGSARTARTSPISAKYHQQSSKSSPNQRSTPQYSPSTLVTSVARNRCKLDHDYSGSNEAFNFEQSKENEDSSMDWIQDNEGNDSVRLDFIRLGSVCGSACTARKSCTHARTSNYIRTIESNEELIADEIDETELNKLRVGEHSSNVEEVAELSYNDEDSSSLEVMDGGLQDQSSTSSIVPGSETPFEEPAEQCSGLLLGNLEIARARAQYLAIAAKPLHARPSVLCRENDPTLPQPNEAEIEAQLQILRSGSSSKFTRRRNIGCAGSSSNDDISSPSSNNVHNIEIQRSEESASFCGKDGGSSTVEEGREPWVLEETDDEEDEDEDDEEDMEKSMFVVDCDEEMQVEHPHSQKDKKQVSFAFSISHLSFKG